ncbi:MAG TPA: hypothetical protein VEC19_07975 [Usitatibacter sp.]|nr:hypothetical protein [Usitatibacter sp.]
MKILLPAATTLLLAGCAFPVIDTELPPGWKSAQRYGTGTHLTPAAGATNTKYLPREEVAEMQRDRFGSRERAPR